MAVTRLICPDDAPRLSELQLDNREFLAPWDPVRPEEFFSVEGQHRAIQGALELHDRGLCVPRVILEDGQVVGRVTLSNIVRLAFQSCTLGYWVAESHTGRGLATAAVGEIKRVAFAQLRLHRIQAAILPHNVASQRVLERNGFVRFGLAPGYLQIAGRWQDHAMYQVLNPDF